MKSELSATACELAAGGGRLDERALFCEAHALLCAAREGPPLGIRRRAGLHWLAFLGVLTDANPLALLEEDG